MADFYGLDLDGSPLEGHFAFIKSGGTIKIGERTFGEGLEHHYKAAMSLMWPRDDWHRWRNLGLQRLATEEINVLMGAGDTGKTYLAAGFVLCDWWAHQPDCLWMVSSTELRGAELRIWGCLKHLYNRARELYPFLQGRVLESKHCITADEIHDDGKVARLLTRGIVFIPCKTGNTWVGLGAYAGVKPTDCGRLGHCGDEVSFMTRAFLDAYANWYGKPNFKGILTGNPTDIQDCLCVAGEPEGGWRNWHDNGKTQEWRSTWYGAWVTAFDGRDTPNNDHPGPLPKYPYLIGPKKLAAVLRAERTEDSPIYRSQAVGKPTPGQEAMKVITWQMCQAGHAFDDVIWEGTERTKGGSLDAAYGGEGGDRCVAMWWEFGKDVDGRDIFCCHMPEIVPIKIEQGPKADSAEIQIAKWCYTYFTSLGIPASNFFFDARATLMRELGIHWSLEVNSVDFGGPATDRPVSQGEYVWEGEQNTRRLQRCNEKYSKFVTELWMSARYCVLGQQMRQLPNIVAEEGTKRIWEWTQHSPRRMEVETKKEMKRRTRESPDYFDCLVTGLEGARRLGFQIQTLGDEAAKSAGQPDWFEAELRKHREFIKKRQLNYRA